MCTCMSVSVAAGGSICVWGVVMEGGFGVVPHKRLNLVDVISCILVHFGDGHYLKINEDS